MNNISTLINTSEPLTKEMVNNWNTIRHILENGTNSTLFEIAPVLSEKYRGDFYGLLKNELGIENKFLYPHLIVNGLASSCSYNGNKLLVKLIDTAVLNKYYLVFKRAQTKK